MSLVLVINAGSSSLKYQLLNPVTDTVIAHGLVERIGSSQSRMTHVAENIERGYHDPHLDHRSALQRVLGELEADGLVLGDLTAVGHRVVHGGTVYRDPTVYDAEVDAAIDALTPLAPLHNPPSLLGLRILSQLLPNVPQVAVFDTAFHSTIPEFASTYALPRALAEQYQVRKYGFHGTSFAYVSRRAANLLGEDPSEVNLIICHLGNGASVAAIKSGRSIDTSMGLSPLAGLVMGTRSGDVDPGVILHLLRSGMPLASVDDCLTRESGLQGLCGHHDMREVRHLASQGDKGARLALDVYAHRVRSYLGAYYAQLPDLHALVFTAGIGENDEEMREEICAPLRHLGVRLDHARNAEALRTERRIDDGSAALRVLVVPTNEELEIAKQALLAASTTGQQPVMR